MKNTFLSLSFFAILALSGRLAAGQNYVQETTIPLPGDGSYDYLAVDQQNSRLYVSHGTQVHVIDTHTQKAVGVIDSMQKVHGIAFVNKLNRGFISDGNANAVIVFDLKTFKKTTTITLTDAKKVDAIVYDANTDRIFTFNGDSNNSSVVDPNTLKQTGSIDMNGAPEFAVTNKKGLMFVNLEDKNSINVINTKTLKVVKNYPLSPSQAPTGIAMDLKNRRLFSVCASKEMSVLDALSGKVITTLPIGVGVDAVAFDPATKLIFCSCADGTTVIFKQITPNKYIEVQKLVTPQRARTLAIDTKTHKLYLSVADYEKGTRNILPNTFRLLIFKPSRL